MIHPADAEDRGIQQGDPVKVQNDKGSCVATAMLKTTVKPGVVSLPTGGWFSPSAGRVDLSGNPNMLTDDCGTSLLGQGAAAHNVGVKVIKASKTQ